MEHHAKEHLNSKLMTSLWPHEPISPSRLGLALLGLIHLLVGELDLVSEGLLERLKVLDVGSLSCTSGLELSLGHPNKTFIMSMTPPLWLSYASWSGAPSES